MSPAQDRPAPTGALDALFGALSDPTRRVLVEQLLADGPATATVLVARLAGQRQLSRQAVVKHLQVLEQAGLVTHARAGREVRYRVTTQPLAAAVRWIIDTAGQWDRRIDRLAGARRG